MADATSRLKVLFERIARAPGLRWLRRSRWSEGLSIALLLSLFALGLVSLYGSTLRVGAAARTPEAPPGTVLLTVQVRNVSNAAAPLPLPLAHVRVLLGDAEQRYAEQTAGETDAQGNVKFRALPSGAAWVLVEAVGYARVSRAVTLLAEHQLQVDLAASQALSITVVDEEEKPLAGATVLIDDSDALPFGGLTDAQGVKLFHRLGAPPWDVAVFARGYEAAKREDVRGDQRFVLRRLGSLRVHVLDAAGQPALGAEVLIVGSTLWPARRAIAAASGEALITGLSPGLYNVRAMLGSQVSDELAGVVLERAEHKRLELRLHAGRTVRVLVVDPSPGYDEPIAGARVVLSEYGLSSFPASAVTGDTGIAFLSPVPLGVAYVSVAADGFVARSAVPVPSEGSEPVRVELLRGATLLGEVTDPDGRPIEGARVEVIGTDTDGLPIDATPLLSAYQEAHFQWSLEPLPLLPGGELGITVGPVPFVTEALSGQPWTTLPADYNPWISDFEGDFRAFPVPPGRVRALVRHPSYVEGISEEVVLGPGGEAKVKVVLSPGGEFVGRVVDDSGRPVPLARLSVSSTRGSFERTSYAAEDGTFSFSAVPSEVAVLLARPDDPTRYVVRQIVQVPAGKTTELELVLPAAREALTVTVEDAEGKAVELAQVQITSLDANVPLRVTRFSDSAGASELEDAAGLRVRVQVTAPGFLLWTEQLAAAPEELTVKLQRGLSISGRVTAVRGRVDLQGARVQLTSGSRRDTAYTDTLGDYRFDNVALGPVRLRVSHDEHASAQLDVVVEATGREDRAFELPTINLSEPATLSGVVVDREGQGVPNVRVGLGFAPAFVAQSQLPEGFVSSDADGRFELLRAAAGEQVLSAYAEAKGRGELRITIEEGRDQQDLRIVLDEAAEQDPNLEGAGVAVTLGERDTAEGVSVSIVDVAPGSEAERAGLATGDALLSVDGAAIDSMAAARQKLNGKAGSDVVVTIERAGEQQSFRVRREPLGR